MENTGALFLAIVFQAAALIWGWNFAQENKPIPASEYAGALADEINAPPNDWVMANPDKTPSLAYRYYSPSRNLFVLVEDSKLTYRKNRVGVARDIQGKWETEHESWLGISYATEQDALFLLRELKPMMVGAKRDFGNPLKDVAEAKPVEAKEADENKNDDEELEWVDEGGR